METIALILNVILLSLVVCGTILLIWKLKFDSKNKILLFILFILYWMAPLMCREYTGQMHIHQDWQENYGAILLWVPLTVYGFAGLLWRPLTDILCYKFKSRKNVIFLSLAIQLVTLWPMFVWPGSFTANIIQSIGTGVGASGIGLFNLMFNEQEHHRKAFSTVSILALPPLIAEVISSCAEAVLCGLVPEHGLPEDTAPTSIYLDYLKWLWLLAIIFVVVSFIIAIFVKEEKQLLFKDHKQKEIVESKHDWLIIVLMALVAICFTFVRWVTAGPSSVTQLIYIAVGNFEHGQNAHFTIDQIEEVKFFEGYLSLIFALGQLVGAIIAAKALARRPNNAKWILVASGSLLWIIYLIINAEEINVHLFFWSNALNGFGYGLIYPVLIGIMLNKSFKKVKIITPIGVFNTAMALGIIGGSLFNNIIKGDIYDFHHDFHSSAIQYFEWPNLLVNYVCVGICLLLVVLFVASYITYKKHPPKYINVGTKFASTGEVEI